MSTVETNLQCGHVRVAIREVKVFSDVISINPKRELKKGAETRFVSMADIKEFDKKIQGYTIRKFSGGSKLDLL